MKSFFIKTVKSLVLFVLFPSVLTFSQTITLPGTTVGTLSPIKIYYAGASGVSASWIGLYRESDGDVNYLSYQYINDSLSGSLIFAGREETGLFNFRLFSGNAYNKIGTSQTFLIRQGALIDPSFGENGIFRKDFLLNNLDDWASAVSVTNEDKIVVAGTAKTGLTDINGFELNEFTVARFNSNGQLDNTFGTNGLVHTPFTTISAKEVRALVVQDNGKIIVGGIGVLQGTYRMYAVLLVQYDVNGNLDNSFGTNGVAITNFRYTAEPGNFCDDDLRCMELSPDGKILVGGGSILNLPYFPGRAFIARYNTNGFLDNNFGSGGFITSEDSIGFRGYVQSIIPPASGGDGSFYAAVMDYAQFGMNSHLIYKLDYDGSFVTSFGNGGIVKETRPGYHNGQYIKSIGLSSDGSLIMMGGSADFAFWLMKRNSSDGSPIYSFGENGLLYSDPTYGNDIPGGMVFFDNKILVGLTTSNRWSTAQITLDGEINLSYGVSFFPVLDGSTTVQSSVGSIAKQTDGKIILIGGSKFPGTNNWDFMTLRFYENPEVFTSIEDEENFPTEFSLKQNYPNPFNPATSIRYTIGSRQFVQLKVYDILGNEIATLVDEEKPAGNYEIEFNPVYSIKNPASGIYFYQLKAGDYTQTKKMILIK